LTWRPWRIKQAFAHFSLQNIGLFDEESVQRLGSCRTNGSQAFFSHENMGTICSSRAAAPGFTSSIVARKFL
jgi:hypothetical protein